MKSRDVGTTITTNDGHVRLRIFDGLIPPDDYHREMAELEAGQHRQTRIERDRALARIAELEVALRLCITRAGMADPVEACRLVIMTADDALAGRQAR